MQLHAFAVASASSDVFASSDMDDEMRATCKVKEGNVGLLRTIKQNPHQNEECLVSEGLFSFSES